MVMFIPPPCTRSSSIHATSPPGFPPSKRAVDSLRPNIRIQGTNYVPGSKGDLFIKSVQRVILPTGPHTEPVTIENCPAGSNIYLVGIDQFLLKSGTLTSSDTAYNIKAMKFSVLPVVQIAVNVRKPADLPKLVEGLRRLSKSDQCVQTWIAESGEHMVAGAGEMHLDICLTELENSYARVPLKRSKPVVGYRETVQAEWSMAARSKTPNKSIHLYVKARPIHERLVNAIEAGKIAARDDYKARAHILANDYGWDATEARRIWCFGPNTSGPNLLVDVTQGVQYVNEIKDSCIAAFQWATKEGVCVEENVRGVRFDIFNVTVVPACRRVCHAAALLADPGLQEPIYLVDIRCPQSDRNSVSTFLNKRRGRVFSEEQRSGTSIVTVKAYIPVTESFGFSRDLKSDTYGQAVTQMVFDHWNTMPGSPLERGSELEALVRSIRVRKGLKPDIPHLDTYYDEL
ncbi:ribosomal protein S5 domain 2-like protein [Athelia psychrophila]|uniref:Ribosomal protein S5 domain 2-like protein n=1 Tax=Athelia psychrophila TaxID=1759441 RepID=A0A166K194_9AGAM|nr:ribosomal protein S5 domain 2-like protein [Fibularhizoctonia sp. CBS 109695]